MEGGRREGEGGRRDYLICGCDGAGVDVVVATPGKLLQLCEGGELTLSSLSYFAVDEADRFLQGTMEEDLRKVCLCLCVVKGTKGLCFTSAPLCADLHSCYQQPPTKTDPPLLCNTAGQSGEVGEISCSQPCKRVMQP